MPTNQNPANLRERARALRALASTIERTRAMSLDQHAGADTWLTPRADVCNWILRANQSQLHHAAEDLRWQAHRLEIEAVELELEAARAKTAS